MKWINLRKPHQISFSRSQSNSSSSPPSRNDRMDTGTQQWTLTVIKSTPPGPLLYAAHGGQARAQLDGELVGETAPVLLAHLVLEAVQDLREHLLQVVLRVGPRGDRVAEEHEIGYDAGRVHLDHLAHAPERGVLLVVVPDVAERRTPARDRPHTISAGGRSTETTATAATYAVTPYCYRSALYHRRCYAKQRYCS